MTNSGVVGIDDAMQQGWLRLFRIRLPRDPVYVWEDG